MSKTNGFRDQTGASTSLYTKEHIKSTHLNHQTQRTIPGLSFLKWFKKNDKSTIDSRFSTKSIGRNFRFKKHYSHEMLSPSSSPNLEYLSPSSSCDSVKSTSTTGFAFIKPYNYNPSNGLAQRFLSAHEIEDINAYRTPNKIKPDLTLRRKYCLYDADTLTSTEGDYDNVRFGDRSLPHLRKKWRENQTTINQKRKTRRTVSDSSKDKKAGAYVHVKGKRKAPLPPLSTTHLANDDISSEILNKSTATLNRKKRRAPPPPSVSRPLSSSFSNGPMQPSNSNENMSDMDLSDIIRSLASNTHNNTTSGISIVRSSAPPLTIDFTAAQKLTEQQKQAVLDNIVKVTTQSASSSESDPKTPLPSPISPRPWYKRPISTHKDSSVPFKREVVLRTMEKRKSKQKEKTPKSESVVETSHQRSSIFDASSKLGFFLWGKHDVDKDKDKRRSGIGIPNISELDREAAEIVHREYAHAQAAEKFESEKFFAKSDHILLQQEMFGSETNIEGNTEECKENEEQEVIKSAKDLISKFEASSNGPRITLNFEFIGRKENFVKQDSKDSNSSLITKTTVDELSIEQSKSQQHNETVTDEPANDKSAIVLPVKNSVGNKPPTEDQSMTKISWTCAFCTLENPGWRIICEVCERIKPYEKRNSIQDKVNQNNKLVTAVPIKEERLTQNPNKAKSKSEQSPEWDKKTEKVLKYFKPKTVVNSPLMKSSSETSVSKSPLSPGKPPSGSPQLGSRNRMINAIHSDITKPSSFSNFFKSTGTIFEEKENSSPLEEMKKPLLDSSVIVTTVTPVFYASAAVMRNSDAEIVGEIKKELKLDTIHLNTNIDQVVEKHDIRSDNRPHLIQNNYDEGEISAVQLHAAPKIDLRQVRKARLAKFDLPQSFNNEETPSSKNLSPEISALSSEPIPIYDYYSLEREKKRLREMIQAMNAKAIAEVSPANTVKKNSPPKEGTKLLESERIETVQLVEAKPDQQNDDQVKLGAIKKVFSRNRSSDSPKKISDYSEPSRSKKVSTSAQTTGIQKKSLTPENTDEKPRISTKKESIYANVPIYENSPLEKYDKDLNLTDNDRVQVQAISKQLTSVQGINDFKESLKNTPRAISATDTVALSKIMRNLETAIAEGQHELAAQIAIDLARMKVSLHVTKQKNRPILRKEADFENNIIIDMFVEDKYSQKGPIQICVTSLFTVSKLKQKIAADFEIPAAVQRWLINDDLALDDEKTLLELGVKDHTATFYLYIIGSDVHFHEVKKTNVDQIQSQLPKIVRTKVKTPEKRNEQAIRPDEVGAAVISQSACKELIDSPGWECNFCTLINSSDRVACLVCTKPKPKKQPLKCGEPLKNDLNKINPNRRSTEIFNIVDIKIDMKKTVTDQMKPIGNLASPNITKIKYRGVDCFNPNRKKGPAPQPRIHMNTSTGKGCPDLPKPTKNHYLELLYLDNADIVSNVETFECPICFTKFKAGEGVTLRDCLHTFCKECLGHTVQYSDDAEVKCPYMDADYSCDSVLQEREVRALVSKDIYELHLVKSMRVAEHQIENAFHCKTPNCRGWCIYEDNVNEFKCPVCKIANCLTCRVVHDGLTCKQYQDRLTTDCDSNIDAKQTKEMLEDMLKNGDAMKCPTCQVVMMKKWGCDWLKCSMCKTEVCWVTRGPRWGPGGKGDTSAGCRCGVNNVKCHPKCNYCH